jgi:hypothetical protein
MIPVDHAIAWPGEPQGKEKLQKTGWEEGGIGP